MPENIPANLRKFALKALYGAVREGLVCSPVQAWAPFVPTADFYISIPHPLTYMFSTPCISATSAPCRKTHPNLRCRHYTARWEKAGFACPYRFGHLLHQLRVFVFQLPILFASCSCAPSISATSVPFRKISANSRKFALTALYGAVREGLVCSPVQVWAPFVPTAGFHISTPHPLSFMFKYTLH